MSSGHDEVEKTEVVVEYNKYMGGVDRGDQLLSYYDFEVCILPTG